MFVVFDTRGRGAGKGRDVSDTKNTPTGWFLVFNTKGKGREVPNTQNTPSWSGDEGGCSVS